MSCNLKRILDPLVKRLRDADADIRHAALTRLFEIMVQGGSHVVSFATLEEVGERVKDKRADIRRTALVGLAKMYSVHVASALPPLVPARGGAGPGDVTKLVDPDVLERLGFVPSLVVKSWGYPDLSSKHLVVTLLQECLLPVNKAAANASSTSDDSQGTSQEDSQQSSVSGQKQGSGCRATALLLLFSLLLPEDRVALSTILSYKSRVRGALKSLLDARIAAKAENSAAGSSSAPMTDDSGRVGAAVKKFVGHLSQLVPVTDKKVPVYDKLLLVK